MPEDKKTGAAPGDMIVPASIKVPERLADCFVNTVQNNALIWWLPFIVCKDCNTCALNPKNRRVTV